METMYNYARYLHILSGMTAFFVAPVALIAVKGGNTHRVWGKVFFWAMVMVAASALPMTLYHPNLFLFLVAIFSFHLSLYGYRSVRRRKHSRHKNDRADLWITCLSFLCYAGFIAWGISLFVTAGNQAFGYISIIFGMIGLRLSLREFKAYQTPPTNKMSWWFDHMQGMVGSYIATLSAFSAVNFVFLPDLIRWLWPTVIGTPLLIIWERYYKNKFNNISKPNLEVEKLKAEGWEKQ